MTKATGQGGAYINNLFCRWLGVTRAIDPPVPCGHRLSFVLFKLFDMNSERDGALGCAKLTT